MSAFQVFDTQTDPASIDPRWRKWILKFANRIKAMNLVDPYWKLVLHLYYAGDDVYDDYRTLAIRHAGGGNNPPPGNGIYSRSVVALNNDYQHTFS